MADDGTMARSTAGHDSVTDVDRAPADLRGFIRFWVYVFGAADRDPDLPRDLQHLTGRARRNARMRSRLLALAAASRWPAASSTGPRAPTRSPAPATSAPSRRRSPSCPWSTPGSGSSAHAGLLINGSEQVLFDPAGTFTHPDLPRRGDVHYGMTPRFVDYYERYHARFDYFVEAQQVPVTRAEADQIIANAKAHGKSMKMTCALAMAEVLQPVPRFPDVPSSLFPEALRAYFAARPGVETSYVTESDVGKNREWEPATVPGRDHGGWRDARSGRSSRPRTAGACPPSCATWSGGRAASACRSATWWTPSTRAPMAR